MNTLSELSTCKEIFFIDDGKRIISAWLFYEERIIRVFVDGHYYDSCEVE